MLDVQQQHTAGVGIVAAVHAGETVVDIVLGKHDLRDAREVLRLMLAHPQQLRRREARKGDVRRERRELFLADDVVEIFHLLAGAPVVPEDGGPYHPVLIVKGDEAVHLSAHADAADAAFVRVLRQLEDAALYGFPPVVGVLLGPARLREGERIVLGHLVEDRARLVHKQQLDGRGTEIDADIVLDNVHLRVVFSCFLRPSGL